MIVISDTSVVTSLFQIDRLFLLQAREDTLERRTQTVCAL